MKQQTTEYSESAARSRIDRLIAEESRIDNAINTHEKARKEEMMSSLSLQSTPHNKTIKEETEEAEADRSK